LEYLEISHISKAKIKANAFLYFTAISGFVHFFAVFVVSSFFKLFFVKVEIIF